MNSIEQFLLSTHYYSPTTLIGFIVVMGLAVWIKNWDLEALHIFLILAAFYYLEVRAVFIKYIVPSDVGNLWYYNIIQIPQLWVTLFFFVSKLASIRKRRVYYFIYILFFFIHIVILTFFLSWLILDIYAIVPMMAVTGVAAIDFLRHTLNDVKINPFMRATFWFAFATAISNLGSVPITSLYLKISSYDMNLGSRIWRFNDVLYSLWFLLTAIGILWINKRKTLSY